MYTYFVAWVLETAQGQHFRNRIITRTAPIRSVEDVEEIEDELAPYGRTRDAVTLLTFTLLTGAM